MPQHDFWPLLQPELQTLSEWKPRASESVSDLTRWTWWPGLAKAAPAPSVGGGLSEAHVLLKVGVCAWLLSGPTGQHGWVLCFLRWVSVTLPDHLPMLACLHAEAPACLVLRWCLPANPLSDKRCSFKDDGSCPFVSPGFYQHTAPLWQRIAFTRTELKIETIRFKSAQRPLVAPLHLTSVVTVFWNINSPQGNYFQRLVLNKDAACLRENTRVLLHGATSQLSVRETFSLNRFYLLTF